MDGLKSWVARVEKSGAIAWLRKVSGCVRPGGAGASPDGGYTVACDSSGVGGPSIVHLDSLGRTAWQRGLAAPAGGTVADAVVTPEAVLVAANGQGKGAPSGWLLRRNHWGLECPAAGKCAGLTLANCDDADPCTRDDCDPQTGCVHEPWPEGTPCGPGKFCTAGKC
jgi:hypothetical protein